MSDTKIQFEFSVTGFAKAGMIEEFLKEHQISYEANIAKPRKGKINVGRRTRITKIELSAVVLCIKKNPTWTDREVGRQTGVSGATVGRIREGSHTLQKNE